MNANNTQHDADETIDMLDETLDDLADLPETKPFPAGAHIAAVKIRKNVKKAGQYIVEMLYQEAIEITNPEDVVPKAGDKSTVFISTKTKEGKPNEFGQGQLKLIMKPIATMLGTNVISEIIEGTKDGVFCALTLSIKKDNTGQYEDSQNILKLEVV